jgi:phage FluMu protein Com
MNDLDIRCKECDRFLKVQPKGTFIAEVTCPDRKCKKVNQIKIVTTESSEKEIRFKFEEKQNG